MGIAVVTIAWFLRLAGDWTLFILPHCTSPVTRRFGEHHDLPRFFRSTKLGPYSKVPSTSETHTALNGLISWKSRHEATEVSFTPIQISINQVVECETDYPPLIITTKRPAEFLDFWDGLKKLCFRPIIFFCSTAHDSSWLLPQLYLILERAPLW